MNTYTLRKHINTLDKYIKLIDNVNNIDYYRRITILDILKKRVNNIKDYLNIDYNKPKKLSFSEIFNNGIKYIEKE